MSHLLTRPYNSHWDSKSSTVPLEGSPSRRKPDITCYFGSPSSRSHHWGQVATFCEVKNRNNKTKKGQSFKDLAGKTSCLTAIQDGRYFVPCIGLLGSCICLTIFDRGGSITTHAFDINSSPKEFLRILIGISLADYSCLGFDMSIEWDGKDGSADEVRSQDGEEIESDGDHASEGVDLNSDDGEVSDEEDLEVEDDEEDEGPDEEDEEPDYEPPSTESNDNRRKWLNVIDKEGRVRKIWLRKILANTDTLHGRGTTVWEGILDSDSPGPEVVVAVKNSWIDPLRKYTEGMILHILQKYKVEGVPQLFAEGQVSAKHFHEDFDVNISTHFIRSKIPNIQSPDDFHLRVLSRLVTLPVGTLLVDFSSLGELLVAFLDCVVGKYQIIFRCYEFSVNISTQKCS